jgi:hypothetical protein
MVLASLLVHAPLTPVFALLGLFSWLAPPADDFEDAPPITAIPIDLIEDPLLGEAPPAPPAPPTPAEPEVAAPELPAEKPKPKVQPKDAGLPDAEAPDAGVPDAEVADAGNDAGIADADADAAADAGPADAGSGKGDGGLGDPVAMVGGDRNQVVDTNANVRLAIYTEKIRRHPLGPRIGKLLGSIYQWRDFFGPAGIDPIRDVDRVMVTGSQLRNSKDVVAILKLNVGEERIRAAIDAIVRADTEHGEWLDASVPAATAYADRAPRVFVLGSPGTVIVTPPSALENVLKGAKRLSLRPSTGPEVALAYIVTPHRVRGLPVRIPDTILWVKITVTPTESGGALLQAVAQDKTPELAEEHAEELERGLNAAASFDLGLIGTFLGLSGRPLVERIQFSAQGAEIHGEAQVTPAQMQELLGLAESFLAAPPRRPAPKATGSVTAPPGAATSRLTGQQPSARVPTPRVPVPSAP